MLSQILMRDDLLLMKRQVVQNLKCFWRKLNRPVEDPKTLIVDTELNGAGIVGSELQKVLR